MKRNGGYTEEIKKTKEIQKEMEKNDGEKGKSGKTKD